MKVVKLAMNDKLTMNELCKRLDNEFDDVDLSVHDSPTKGTVAVVYFYEDKFEEVLEDE
tara:strand:- start:717 stop:893 length:177 start_codon:yes stop_codon:yes gene_type:complete